MRGRSRGLSGCVRLCSGARGRPAGCAARPDEVGATVSLRVERAGLEVDAGGGGGEGSGGGSGSAGNVTAGGSTGGGVGSSARALDAKSAPVVSKSNSAHPAARGGHRRPGTHVGPVLLGGVSMTGPLRRISSHAYARAPAAPGQLARRPGLGAPRAAGRRAGPKIGPVELRAVSRWLSIFRLGSRSTPSACFAEQARE